MNSIGSVLRFKVEGFMGHFKKYYSNVSSLTYEIPPRTVIMGMLASLLEMPRDSYYDFLHPERCKIGCSIRSPSRKLMQCMNYLVKDGGHTQVRLELLLPANSKLQYEIYVTHADEEVVDTLYKTISKHDPGYGLYLGQRPFRASTKNPELIPPDNIEVQGKVEAEIDTLTFENNIIETNPEGDFSLDIASVSMPVSMREAGGGREPEDTGMMIFERQGNPLPGTFKQVITVNEKNISFFTPL